MLRKTFSMELKPGMAGEYEKAHNPIWPEFHAVLKEHGIYNYSIFHDRTKNLLFAYLEIADEGKFTEIANNEIAHKWWLYMKKFLVSDSENSLKAREEELCEVFHID